MSGYGRLMTPFLRTGPSLSHAHASTRARARARPHARPPAAGAAQTVACDLDRQRSSNEEQVCEPQGLHGRGGTLPPEGQRAASLGREPALLLPRQPGPSGAAAELRMPRDPPDRQHLRYVGPAVFGPTKASAEGGGRVLDGGRTARGRSYPRDSARAVGPCVATAMTHGWGTAHGHQEPVTPTQPRARGPHQHTFPCHQRCRAQGAKGHWGWDNRMMLQGAKQTSHSLEVGYAKRSKKGGYVALSPKCGPAWL